MVPGKLFRVVRWCMSGIFVCGVVFISCVYLLETGVNYRGWLRLKYNWEYLFETDPSYPLNYKGNLFSFTYMTNTKTDSMLRSPIVPSDSLIGRWLDIHWYQSVPPAIKNELSIFLASGGKQDWTPSPEFQKWLFHRTDVYIADKAQFLRFKKDATPAAYIIVRARRSGWRGNHRYLVTMSRSGLILKANNLLGSAISYEDYKKNDSSRFEQYSGLIHYTPAPAIDHLNRRAFDKFVETFRFNL